MQQLVSDPPPIPPEKPLPSDCCESGCDRCVFDIYADEVTHYELGLAAWQARKEGGVSAQATGDKALQNLDSTPRTPPQAK